MQRFLSLSNSTRKAPNENYARELMELFTIGSGYSEDDIREAARALTGFRITRNPDTGLPTVVTFEDSRHDNKPKTIFGQTGNFSWQDVLDLCIAHPAHPPFLCSK